MRKQVLLILFLLTSREVWGQAISFGVKGGVPFTGRTAPNDESRPYIVGASFEVRLPAGFAIEADALYQRLGNTSWYYLPQEAGTSLLLNRQRGNSWQFPMLGKYYFRRNSSLWQPFVGTGWAFRTTGLHQDVSLLTATNESNHASSAHADSRSDLGVGAVFAAGVRLHKGRFAFLPELRYTRWGSSSFQTRKNEAGFLFGISF